MLRLKTRITFSLFSELEFRLKTIWKDRLKRQYVSSEPYSFKYNYVVSSGEDNSFWIFS